MVSPTTSTGDVVANLPRPAICVDVAVGSNHSRGTAIDLTLLMSTGTSWIWVQSSMKCTNVPCLSPFRPARRSAQSPVAEWIMTGGGFVGISSEWWHFELPMQRVTHFSLINSPVLYPLATARQLIRKLS